MNNHPRRWPAPHKDQRQDRRLEQNKMRRPKQLHSSRTQSEPGAARRYGANENRNVRRKCFLPRGVQRALAILTRKISVVLVLSRLNSFAQTESWDLSQDRHDRSPPVCSAVTLFARFPGLSTSSPRARKKMSRTGPPPPGIPPLDLLCSIMFPPYSAVNWFAQKCKIQILNLHIKGILL